MNNYQRFAALLLAFPAPLFAQDQTSAVPSELLTARAHYQDVLARDKQQYLQVLQQLRATAQTTNDSVLAQAVSAEIQSLGATDTSAPSLDATDDTPLASLTAKLVNTAWVWDADQYVILLPDGKARWSHSHVATMTWRVIGSSPPKIEGIDFEGKKYRMILDDSLTTGKLFSGTLPMRLTARGTMKDAAW
jgi:hypothetical protein